MTGPKQTDNEAANAAVPNTETMPAWDDPDWEAYLFAIGDRDTADDDDDDDEFDDSDDRGDFDEEYEPDSDGEDDEDDDDSQK